MKKLFFTFALSAICSLASAQTLSVPDVEVKAGEKASFTLIVNTGDFKARGFEFHNLVLPEGVTLTKKTTTANSSFSITISDDLLSGFCGALTADEFPQNEDYEVGTIELEVGSDLTVDTELEVVFPENSFMFYNSEGSVYVKDKVTFKVKVVDYISFDETSSKLPNYDEGQTSKVQMKRTLKAGEWSTIILPFSLTMKNAQAVFGTDVELAQLENIETTFASEEDLTPVAIKVNFKTYTLSALNKMKGGVPYLIKVSKSIDKPFIVEGVTLTKELSETSVKDAAYEDALTGKMKGSFTTGTIPANSLFISENKFWYSTGETNVKAFRCWFVLDPIIGKNFAESRISFAIDDEPTMVEGFATEPILDGEYYDLKGQRVETPSKGIYIKNGKKVVVK